MLELSGLAGVQASDELAVFVRLRAASLALFAGYGALDVMVEWSPTERVSLALGPGILQVGAVYGGLVSQTVVGVPMRLAFALGEIRPNAQGARSHYRIALEGSAGVSLQQTPAGVGQVLLTFGFDWR